MKQKKEEKSLEGADFIGVNLVLALLFISKGVLFSFIIELLLAFLFFSWDFFNWTFIRFGIVCGFGVYVWNIYKRGFAK